MFGFGKKEETKSEPVVEQQAASSVVEAPKEKAELSPKEMFKPKKVEKKEKVYMEYEVILSKNTAINGNISVNGCTRIDGYVEGTLTVNSTLLVGETGNIKANVYVDNMTVAGTVTGEIVCKGKLELLASAKISGEIKYGALVINEGAAISGNMARIEEGK